MQHNEKNDQFKIKYLVSEPMIHDQQQKSTFESSEMVIADLVGVKGKESMLTCGPDTLEHTKSANSLLKSEIVDLNVNNKDQRID